MTIAAHLPLAGGRVQGARVAYGAMAPTPIRVTAVERALEGKSLDEAGIAARSRGDRRHRARDRSDRQRLVPPRGGAGSSETPACWAGIAS